MYTVYYTLCIPCDCNSCRTSATYSDNEGWLLLYMSKNTDTGKQVATKETVYTQETVY